MLDEEGGLVFHLGSNPGGYRDVYIGFSARRRKQRRPSLGHHTETWCGKWILGTPLGRARTSRKWSHRIGGANGPNLVFVIATRTVPNWSFVLI